MTIGWHFDNTYSKLSKTFKEEIKPIPVDNPKLIILNKELATDLNLDFSKVDNKDLAKLFSGNLLPEGANDNSEGQIVLSGRIDDLDKLIVILKENMIKSIKLPVSAPFHCNLMNKATQIMRKEINELNFIQSENKLISNVTAKEISSTDKLKDLLIKQIENRVRWRESVINMINNDVNHFIEIGPGKVLSGLVKRINKEVKISTINNQGDIEGLEI
ncbi:hypothetical protein OAM73_03950 [Candidatus Pelagibacter sp.]|nr:hypothetical protein [Candidatus Pelagibacter sp.]